MRDPYVVEVETSTHELLKAGVLASIRGLTGSRYRGPAEHPEQAPGRAVLVDGPTYTVVIVSPDEVKTDAEAMLVAAQMAACTSGQMPTKTTLISWPTEE
jgi:hypothetical protein